MGKMQRMCKLVILKLRKHSCFILKMKVESEEDDREDDQNCHSDNRPMLPHLFEELIISYDKFHPSVTLPGMDLLLNLTRICQRINKVNSVFRQRKTCICRLLSPNVTEPDRLILQLQAIRSKPRLRRGNAFADVSLST